MTRPLLAAALVALAALSTTRLASATESPAPIAVGEIADSTSADLVALRDAAEGELRQLDTSKLKRRYVVSFSLARKSVKDSIACTASAILRDAKSGAMIAIIEGGAQASGAGDDEVAKRVAHAAVRSAMRRIQSALP